MFVKFFDEDPMRRLELSRRPVKAQRVASLPLQETLARKDLVEAQPDSLQQRLQLVFHAFPDAMARPARPPSLGFLPVRGDDQVWYQLMP